MARDEGDEIADAPVAERPLIRRHAPAARLWHWLNAGLLLLLLASGLAIFNAHPRLYWGASGNIHDPAWFAIGHKGKEGYLRVGDREVPTTGVLGVRATPDGTLKARAFPAWATLPANSSLATARRWHLTAAWGFAALGALYAVWTLLSGHFRRDLCPERGELRPRHLARTCARHALLRLPRGAEAARYNVLQKLAYLSVIFVALPLMLLSGLAMSPFLVAEWPWLLDLFAGRQSARSVHFLGAAALVAFVIVHLAMVLAAGPLNQLRAMITGRYRLPKERHE